MGIGWLSKASLSADFPLYALATSRRVFTMEKWPTQQTSGEP